jgi:hypothetical protein
MKHTDSCHPDSIEADDAQMNHGVVILDGKLAQYHLQCGWWFQNRRAL